jgi:SulP family sulfate permease
MTRFKLNVLTRTNLRGDLFGGLTAAIIALPLALAFGVASGAGPIAGLFGAIFVGLFASLFGGTPSQISGPTGPLTIVAASIFTQYAGEPALAFTIIMMAGAFQVLLGIARIGRYVNLMPYPVISGFMSGIGCILIIMQIGPLLGYSGTSTVISALTVIPAEFSDFNADALIVGSVTFVITVVTPRHVSRLFPSTLLALITGTLLALWLNSAPLLGDIPSALPSLHIPQIEFSRLGEMLVFAAIIGALGSIDSLLTSLVADNVTQTYHDSDKELVGQGIGNFIAGLLGGIPGAGATIRTLTNIKAGGRTPLSGIVHSIVLIFIMLALGPAVAFIPYAVLAGILLKVGIDVIDWRFLRRYLKLPRIDQVLTVVVLLLTVFVDVITAVGVGIVLASLALVKETADLQIQAISAIADPASARFLTAEENDLLIQCQGKVLILHLSGLISFGAASELTRRMAKQKDYPIFIIDLLEVRHIDGSAALALDQIIERALMDNRKVLIVGLNYVVARRLGHMGILERVRETERFATRQAALKYIIALITK